MDEGLTLHRIQKIYDELTPEQIAEIQQSKHHLTRFSDATTFDEICMLCGATDNPIGMRRDGIRLDTCPIGKAILELIAALERRKAAAATPAPNLPTEDTQNGLE